MKNIILLFISFYSLTLHSQTPTITINLPPNPSSDTSQWGTGSNIFNIFVAGANMGMLMESNVLVTIKSNGSIKCGSYTPETAQSSNIINATPKSWIGSSAAALLGQDYCILTPGNYEICVQFYGYKSGSHNALLLEKCVPFIIQEKIEENFSPPQNILPTDGKKMTEAEAKSIIKFIWTPVLPKPKELVTYKLRVWQLMQGQTGVQAMKTNQPIIEKDVENMTQAIIPNLLQDPCKPPYLCDFVWNVQAFNKEGIPIGGKDGMSESSQFTFGENQNKEPKCLPSYKAIIDKITCEGDRILINGHIEIPSSNAAKVGNIFITGITQNTGNNLSNSYAQLPEQIIGSGNGNPNNFEFYIDNKNCRQDLVIEYEINSSCDDTKTQAKSQGRTQVIKDKIIIPAKDIVCCGENHESVCLNNPILNGDFVLESIPGPMPSGQLANWSLAYGNPTNGNPIVNNTVGQGCFDAGYVVLTGNNFSGNAISQSFNSANKIISGRKYTFYVSVRFLKVQNLDYAKIRLIAYNGSLPTNGSHPLPQTDIAIIGRSGKIHDCGDWSIIEFPVWKANKNFDKIAINAFTDDNISSGVFIDNISACETTQSDCAELQLDREGKPIPPPGYGGPLPVGSCEPVEEAESYFNGSLVDLYGYDGTPNMYSDENSDDCATIGGTLPPEFQNYDCDANLRESGSNCEEMDKLINTDLTSIPDVPMEVPQIAPLSKRPSCKPLSAGDKSSMAFNGRDIIFVHGLQFNHITDRLRFNHPGAQADWPDKAEFYGNGYYKRVANENWKHHIQHFLQGKGRKNRYLIVTYNCSQRADFAIHSVMSQIRDAMENGTDVVADKRDPRGTKCFGQDYVMISHSTGGLIGDLVLAKANKSKTDITEKTKYGDVGFISDKCKGHIAMHGAMGGSNLATIVVAAQAGIGYSPGGAVLSVVLDALNAHTLSSIILTSVLVDLTPSVTYYKWRWDLDDVPVPVFTVAGGHPAAFFGALVSILPGIDDGVVSMESGSGRNKPFISPISQFATLWPPKVYDMGIEPERASGFFRDSRRGIDRFGIASSQYLSQTGMVEPKHSIFYINPQFNNHYTFIQSTAEHLQPATNAYFGLNNYWNTVQGSINNEEELVTDNQSLYNGLINPAIINEMGESIAGHKMYYPNLRFKRGRFYIFWKSFWIWKRTYHKLNGNAYDMDYAYKYLFPQ